MAKEKTADVITIDDVEYNRNDLSNEAHYFINHLHSLDQKIASARFNLDQLSMGREAVAAKLREQLDNGQANSTVSPSKN